MEKVKKFIKRQPLLYGVLRKTYLPLVLQYASFKSYLQRNRLGDLWALGYFHRNTRMMHPYSCPIDHPHRSFLISRMARSSPLSGILEIGCDTGPNLHLLAKEFPYADIRGVDINPEAVETGNNWFTQQGISNVKLFVGRAEELGRFPDKSFDVVFTDAVLIYVSQNKIYQVIGEMTRIARKRLILLERHDSQQRLKDKRGLGIFIDGIWVRDYVTLLEQFVSEEQIRVTRVDENIWPDKGWNRHGAIIEVTLR